MERSTPNLLKARQPFLCQQCHEPTSHRGNVASLTGTSTGANTAGAGLSELPHQHPRHQQPGEYLQRTHVPPLAPGRQEIESMDARDAFRLTTRHRRRARGDIPAFAAELDPAKPGFRGQRRRGLRHQRRQAVRAVQRHQRGSGAYGLFDLYLTGATTRPAPGCASTDATWGWRAASCASSTTARVTGATSSSTGRIPRYEPYTVTTGVGGIGSNNLTVPATPTSGVLDSISRRAATRLDWGSTRFCAAGWDFTVRFRNEEKEGARDIRPRHDRNPGGIRREFRVYARAHQLDHAPARGPAGLHRRKAPALRRLLRHHVQ